MSDTLNELINKAKSAVAEAKRNGSEMVYTSWGMQEGFLISINEAKELIALHEWKSSAMKLLNDLNLQEIAKEMGLKPGQDIVSNILPFIKKLKDPHFLLPPTKHM